MGRSLRSAVAVLLIIVLAIFVLWRYEKLSPLGDVADSLVQKLEQNINQLMQSILPGEEEDDTPPPEDGPAKPTDPGSNFSDYNPTTPVDAALEEAILTGLLAMESDIDLKAYAITKAELATAMANIIYSGPELFYLDSAYSYSIDGSQHIVSLKPVYTHTPAEVATMREAYSAVLAEIVANAPMTGSDFDKILYLHDYFVRNYSYDKTLTIRDAYTFFTQKTGVCQAYMLGLIAAAEAVGLESLPVTSDAMKHAWNLVKIDGAWYHVDLTWDDSNTLPTRISYTYFLQSDAGLSAIDAGKSDDSRHYNWAAAEPALDTTYDQALFRGANTNMVRYNGTYYVAVKDKDAASNVRGTVYCGTDPMVLGELTDIAGGAFSAGAGYYYPDCFCDLFLEDGVLYYHSGNSVGYVDLKADTLQYRVILPDGLVSGESIYGFLGKTGDTLTVVISTSPDSTAYRTAAVVIP